jgi:RNA polymerase sigma-70 factor (ECF subfamily)
MIEDELVRQAQQGDRGALEEICRLEWRPIYGLLYHAVQNRTEAQDLTQEVFLRALRAFDRYQLTEAPFHVFLVTIARNLLRDRWRRRVLPSAALEDAAELTAAEPGPEQLVLASVDRLMVEQALASLPNDYQSVIRLRILEARPAKDVADLMGRRPDAIRQLQRRALVALRTALKEETLV